MGEVRSLGVEVTMRVEPAALDRTVTLLRSLMADAGENVWVRVGASRALGLLTSEPSAVESLTSIVDDPGAGVSAQIAAAAALAELGRDDVAVERMVRLAGEGSDDDFDRLRLAILLYEHGERSVAFTLFDDLRASMRRNDLLKHELPMSLERLGEHDAAASCYAMSALDGEVEAFKRESAVAGLSGLDAPEAMSTFLTLVRDPKHPQSCGWRHPQRFVTPDRRTTLFECSEVSPRRSTTTRSSR